MMKEYCHRSLDWYSFDEIIRVGSGFTIKDLSVRWNENQITREGPEEEKQIEYEYDTIQFDFQLPPEVSPGREAVEYYLEQAKDSVLTLAKDLLVQHEGFDAIN